MFAVNIINEVLKKAKEKGEESEFISKSISLERTDEMREIVEALVKDEKVTFTLKPNYRIRGIGESVSRIQGWDLTIQKLVDK